MTYWDLWYEVNWNPEADNFQGAIDILSNIWCGAYSSLGLAYTSKMLVPARAYSNVAKSVNTTGVSGAASSQTPTIKNSISSYHELTLQ